MRTIIFLLFIVCHTLNGQGLSVGGPDRNILDRFVVKRNPAQNYLTFSQIKIGNTLEILDMSGRQLKTLKVMSGEINIHLEDLLPGLYPLKVSNDFQSATRKVIIE